LLGLGTGAQAVPVNLRYCYAVSVYSDQVSLGASIGALAESSFGDGLLMLAA
jgi:hypothetical protein